MEPFGNAAAAPPGTGPWSATGNPRPSGPPPGARYRARTSPPSQWAPVAADQNSVPRSNSLLLPPSMDRVSAVGQPSVPSTPPVVHQAVRTSLATACAPVAVEE